MHDTMFYNRKKRRSTTESFLYSLKKNFLYFFTMLLSHQINRYSVSHHENTKSSSGLSALYKALLLSSIYWRARRIHMKTLPIRYTSPYFFFFCVLRHLALPHLHRIHVSVCFVCLVCTFLQDWRDQNLIWNPANYSGVKDVRIPPNRIWKPDILLYNRYLYRY